MKSYGENKDLSQAYIKKEPIENNGSTNPTILGLTLGVFVVIFLIAIVLWIIALVLLVNNWNKLPSWAQVVGVLGVLPVIPGGPIITIVVVLIAREG